MMNQDGVRNGYDLEQLKKVREVCHVLLIASGGAGTMEHFLNAFHAMLTLSRAGSFRIPQTNNQYW